MNENKVKSHECQYCGKEFTTGYSCTRHERTHTGEKPYKCQYCGNCFTTANGCITHERIHTGDKPYKCQYCEKSFSRVDSRTRHERVHTGEKPYTCRYCDKSFTTRISCTRHETIHTGETPPSYYRSRRARKNSRIKSEKSEKADCSRKVCAPSSPFNFDTSEHHQTPSTSTDNDNNLFSTFLSTPNYVKPPFYFLHCDQQFVSEPSFNRTSKLQEKIQPIDQTNLIFVKHEGTPLENNLNRR